VKHDLKLWRLILRHVCDGTPPPELASYDEKEVAYNSALLVDEGFVDGEPFRDGSGQYSGAAMLNLTNKGHDLLEKLEAENQTLDREPPMKRPSQEPLSIFISHSAKDEKLAGALVALLRSALNIAADKIRCTSVNGYRLEAGAETEQELRREVHEAKAFIGLITPSSMASAYVMFELGARWGAHLHLAPLLGAGAGSEYLRGPLASLNALNCEEPAQVHQLIGDLAKVLVVEPSKPAVYEDLITTLVETSKSGRPAQTSLPASKPATENKSAAERVDEVLEATKLDEGGPGWSYNHFGVQRQPSQEEIDVLKLFSKIRGSTGLTKEHIAESLSLHPLKADQLLDRLVKRDLLNHVVRMGMPMSYRLASAGRDYLIEHNLL
jgi:hypothetical protein